MTKEYTQDWHHHPHEWLKVLGPLATQPLNVLEIGSFEGRSVCWMMDNVCRHPDSRITSVDPYHYQSVDNESVKEAAHFNKFDLEACRERFLRNTAEYGDRVKSIRMTSFQYLKECCDTFDIIVIDGGHAALLALTDLVLCYPILKKGGIMVMDDIGWQWGDGPKRALASFLTCSKSLVPISKGYVWFLKKA